MGRREGNTRAEHYKSPLSSCCILLIKSSFSQENSKKNKAKESSSWRGMGEEENSEKPAFDISLHKTAKKRFYAPSSFPPLRG
jgi:hypothetical protein